ncbi:BTB/POZ protein [Pycnococcus provasolii]
MPLANSGNSNKRRREDEDDDEELARHHDSAVAARRITVDAGGTRFVTSFATIEACGGYLAAAVKRDLAGAEASDENTPSIFVDRDPELFKHVLAWMRAGRLPAAVATNAALLDDLTNEATFFALDDLCAECKKALKELANCLAVYEPKAESFVLEVTRKEPSKQQRVTIEDGELLYISHAMFNSDAECDPFNYLAMRPITDEFEDCTLTWPADSDTGCPKYMELAIRNERNSDIQIPINRVFSHGLNFVTYPGESWLVYGWKGEREAIPPLMAHSRAGTGAVRLQGTVDFYNKHGDVGSNGR